MFHLLYIFFRALIIFYCITVIFADNLLFGGGGYNAFYIENKLYFIGSYLQDHFYIDLKDLSLENGTIYNAPRISVDSPPNYVVSKNPFIGGNSNKKLFFIDKKSTYGLYVDTFNTELNKWETNNSYKGLPNEDLSFDRAWVTNEATGISYSFQGELNTFSIPGCIPVLLSSGQILYIGGKLYSFNQTLMNRILTYDSIKDSWQINNTTGKTPEERTGHTAVLTSDGRVIVYGGENNLSKSAIPYLTILDTSKTPFMWSTPIEENSIGSLNSHTSVMVKNYMITAFGTNSSEKGLNQIFKNIYKLDTSNLSNYKWSLLFKYEVEQSIPISNKNSSQTSPITPIQTNSTSDKDNASFNNFVSTRLSTRWIIAILVIVIALICLLIFLIYKFILNKKI
ncbi:galactose oxidase [Gigaspora margarita]|uniref:Galactose oxidase n=1 Tax=Gigaspora margarita TaxID=4874 RepID=A0A8H3XDX8_GIGMA|nr:galactose oxidase [Gigaspora margarita]